ncbi:hypothetical protein Tco_0052495 [Tanacetum coccineum]
MEGYKLKFMKLKEFDSIQEMFDRAFKRVNTFEDFRTELVEGKEKRAGTELVQEITKKQKVEDDKETVELKSLMKIIPDTDEVSIDAIPLAVKSPSIVDWKIYKEGRKSYYQIIRADGKSQMYMIFSQMLKSFDREDLEDLYKLVKAKYESTRPVEDLDLLLWGDLKTMFEPNVDDKIYMLVEKKYPLAPLTLSMMLEKKLMIDYETGFSASHELQRKYAKCFTIASTKLLLLVNVSTAQDTLVEHSNFFNTLDMLELDKLELVQSTLLFYFPKLSDFPYIFSFDQEVKHVLLLYHIGFSSCHQEHLTYVFDHQKLESMTLLKNLVLLPQMVLHHH